MDKSTIIGICLAALAGYLLYRYMGNGDSTDHDTPDNNGGTMQNRVAEGIRTPSNNSTQKGRVTTQAGTTGRTSGTTEPHRVGTPDGTEKINTRTNQNRTT